MPQAPENGANGLVMTPKEDGKFFARDFKRWLQTRAQEWARGSDFAWRGKCESRFGRVPQLNHMSILELEETLIDIGDTDVTGIREQTEALHDGVVTGFLKDKSQPWGEAIACFIESYAFDSCRRRAQSFKFFVFLHFLVSFLRFKTDSHIT